MKDIVRLEAPSLSLSNASARLYAQVPTAAAASHASLPRLEEHNDRVSVSAAAQSLSVSANAARESTSAQRLGSLQDRILADSLEIDLSAIADNMLRDMSRE